MQEPVVETFSELSAADWTCIAFNVGLALAGLRTLRRWPSGGGPRLERRADPATASAGLMTALLAFGLILPLLSQFIAGFFRTEFGVTQAEIFFATFVAQATAAGAIIGFGAFLPGSVQWTPTAAPEGVTTSPDSPRQALRLLRWRDVLRAYLAVCALALVGSTLHVKSLIRERRRPGFARASRWFSLACLAAATGLAVTGTPWPLMPATLAALRTHLLRDPSLRPGRIGMVELGVLVVLAGCAWWA